MQQLPRDLRRLPHQQPKSVAEAGSKGRSCARAMSRTCTACHGSRVKNEYYGLNEGYPGDVHLRQGRLACTDCHTSAELHGQDGLSEVVHRYEGAQAPTCESCHEDQIGPDSGIPEHDIHGKDLLSCQTCHSVAYTNCTNCHVDRSEDDVPFYTIESHDVGFFIGRNPTRNNERPYRYVPVRHVPVDPNSFERYGEDLLVNFLNRPTWAYATPHNIQRETPQNASCTSCHDNDAVFLTLDKVAESERGGANLDVIVERAPAFPEGYEQYLEEEAPAGEGAALRAATRASGRTRPRAPRRTMAASGPTTPRLRRRAIAPPISGASLRPRPARIAPRTFGGSERDRLLAAPPDGMVQREPAPASPGRTRASINCRRTIVRKLGEDPQPVMRKFAYAPGFDPGSPAGAAVWCGAGAGEHRRSGRAPDL